MEKEEFVKSRIKLAKEKLKAAQNLFQKKFYRDCISRCYYAMYHTAKAMLVLKGKDPYTHKGVKILLSQELVKGKILQKDIYNLFVMAKERREDADYRELIKINKIDAEKALKDANIFIKESLDIIKNIK